MLELKITNKQELIRLIQSANIKKIDAADINNKDDIKEMTRAAEQHLRSNNKITMFIITT
jgi:hypothetical protein